MKVFLDMDGVIVDFVGGAAKHYNFSPTKVTRYNFFEDLGFTPADFWRPLGEEFWANLDWTLEGKKLVAFLEKLFGPSNICLLTTPCDTPGCAEGKIQWIRKHMPDYKNRYLLGHAKWFLSATNASVLIDDREENVDLFAQAGGHAVLVPRPWNRLRGFESYTYVTGMWN